MTKNLKLFIIALGFFAVLSCNNPGDHQHDDAANKEVEVQPKEENDKVKLKVDPDKKKLDIETKDVEIDVNTDDSI